MKSASDYPAPGELLPCRHADHQAMRASLTAFKAGTHWDKRFEWEGYTYANCVLCSSTIAIEIKETK